MTMVERSEPSHSDRQRSDVELRFAKAIELKASVDVSSTGLLAISVLVTGILLSTAVLVGTAVREGRRFPRWSA